MAARQVHMHSALLSSSIWLFMLRVLCPSLSLSPINTLTSTVIPTARFQHIWVTPHAHGWCMGWKLKQSHPSPVRQTQSARLLVTMNSAHSPWHFGQSWPAWFWGWVCSGVPVYWPPEGTILEVVWECILETAWPPLWLQALEAGLLFLKSWLRGILRVGVVKAVSLGMGKLPLAAWMWTARHQTELIRTHCQSRWTPSTSLCMKLSNKREQPQHLLSPGTGCFVSHIPSCKP